MADLGPFASIVSVAGCAVAAAVSIRVAWAGKVLWEPEIQGISKAPGRVSGAISAVSLLFLFGFSQVHDDADFGFVLITLLFLGIFSFLVYVFLVTFLVVQCSPKSRKVIGGFWLTPPARDILSGSSSHLLPDQRPPGSAKELFCGAGQDPDRVWSPASQASAKTVLIVSYIFFIVSMTTALATGALLVGRSSDQNGALSVAVDRWTTAAEDAKSKGSITTGAQLPVSLTRARSEFETSWQNSGFAIRMAVDQAKLWKGLTYTTGTHRLEEYDNRFKTASLYWADQAIAYFEQTQNRKFLAEALLDKSAVYLELSQLDHMDGAEFRKMSEDGDKVISRAADLSDSEQKPGTFRIWSRFYYNLARPANNVLSGKWDNSYLQLAVERASEAVKLAPNQLSYIVQLSRAVQKYAANPPQDASPDWTQRLQTIQTQLVGAWSKSNISNFADRIPPMDILGNITIDLIMREFKELNDPGLLDRKRLVAEIIEHGVAPLSEARALVKNTELRGRYSFDIAYDLARAKAVICQIEANETVAQANCDEAVDLFKEARESGSAIQIQAARQSMENHPTLSGLSSLQKERLNKALNGE